MAMEMEMAREYRVVVYGPENPRGEVVRQGLDLHAALEALNEERARLMKRLGASILKTGYQGRSSAAWVQRPEGKVEQILLERSDGRQLRPVDCPHCLGEADDPDTPESVHGCPMCGGFGFVLG
jgi:hypothetical protein